MKPVKTMVIQDTAEFIDKIDAIAAGRGVSRSDVVREYLRSRIKDTDIVPPNAA
jgi:metal-responsive CopG/Arc/MetJ family transcriptional regulator